MGRILVAKAASLKGGEELLCVGHCRPTAGHSWAREPSWWHLWEPLVAVYLGMGKCCPAGVRESVRTSPVGTRSEEGGDSLAAWGIDHAGAEPRAAACGGLTLEQEKVWEGRSGSEQLFQNDQMLPYPNLPGHREQGRRRIGKEVKLSLWLQGEWEKGVLGLVLISHNPILFYLAIN